ncbi:ras-related and estrogen-regulated growth inhibitor-like protein [Protobothrops mucrosquamatus]|uniref:ras-related and estrogen-regulated growth inhibitor-like protein n=1 Tax=Protobothrops mucrosquamatus TaxID=103944 RepID=UPI0010FB7AA8|nr:ras-related and estrogen-regulated growth inhibitor-like protein [Protobothrops mucrosquamatus]
MLVHLKTAFRQAGKMPQGILPKLEANVLVLGAEKVGKSALTVRFLTRRFIGEYGNIESIYNHNMKVAGQRASFSIWDSACPQVDNLQSCLNEKQLHWADGFLIVYSICDRASFAFARHQLHWLRRCSKRRNGRRRAPIVLVGNKRDLQHQRAVSSEEGRLLALSTNSGFFEISTAETYHGSLVVFNELLNLVQDSKSLTKKTVGIREIVRSVSAIFGRRRAD